MLGSPSELFKCSLNKAERSTQKNTKLYCPGLPAYCMVSNFVNVVFAGKDNKTDWLCSAFKNIISFQIAKIWPPLNHQKLINLSFEFGWVLQPAIKINHLWAITISGWSLGNNIHVGEAAKPLSKSLPGYLSKGHQSPNNLSSRLDV